MRARLCRLLTIATGASLEGREVVTSRQLGRLGGSHHTLVRRDLRRLGIDGRRGVGFQVEDLVGRLRAVLRPGVVRLAVVGDDGFATSLARSPTLARLGIEVACAFHADPPVRPAGEGMEVLPLDRLEREVRTRELEVAAITCTAKDAQAACERLGAAGIHLVISFGGPILDPPAGVTVHAPTPAPHLLLSLARRY